MLTTNTVQQLLVRSVKLCHCQTSSLSAVRAMSSHRKEHLELTSDQYRVKQCLVLFEVESLAGIVFRTLRLFPPKLWP